MVHRKFLWLVPMLLFAFGPAALQAAPPQQAQNGHARPPIRFNPVTAPNKNGSPGKGPRSSSTSVVYSPASIQKAYGFSGSADGSGETIAIVDAYGDPSMSSDLAAFNLRFGLPSGTLNVYHVDGNPTSTNSGWATETALDVEWAHANAPNATIALVIVPDSSFQHLTDGVNYVAQQNISGVVAISMSWGAPDVYVTGSTRTAFENAFQTARNHGMVLLAASGDNGAYDGTRPQTLSSDYPAASPLVIGVGGTSLHLNGGGGYGSESAWSGSGGGYDATVAEPSWQTTAQITDSSGTRGVPDVAFDADPNTGLYVYYNGSWYSVGGTSVGAPNWAAIVADMAASSNGLPSNLTSYLYGTVYGVNGNSGVYGSQMHDVTSGNNGYYYAGTGWDAVTGLGTPQVGNLIGAASASPDFSLSASPSSLTLTQGDSGTTTITVNDINGFNGSVSLSVSGVPSNTAATFSSNTLTIATTASTPTGSYQLTVTGTDIADNLTHTVVVGLDVTSASTASTVSMQPISYSTSGGKNHDKNLFVTLALVAGPRVALSGRRGRPWIQGVSSSLRLAIAAASWRPSSPDRLRYPPGLHAPPSFPAPTVDCRLSASRWMCHNFRPPPPESS